MRLHARIGRRVLSAIDYSRAWKLLPAPQPAIAATILTFHRVCPDNEQPLDDDIHVTVGQLDAIVRMVRARGYDIVSLDELCARVDGAPSQRPMVAITFDDGFRDSLELAAPVLARHAVPWTLFLATGLPDRTCCNWWGALAQVVASNDTVEIDVPSFRGRLASRTLPQKRRAMLKLSAQLRAEGPLVASYLAQRYSVRGSDLVAAEGITWDEVKALRHRFGVEIGAHSISHSVLSSLPEEKAWQEIAGSGARIEQMLAVKPKHFAPPHGDAASIRPIHATMARQAGYKTMSTTLQSSIPKGAAHEPFALPRFTVRGGSNCLPALERVLAGYSGLGAMCAQIPWRKTKASASNPLAPTSSALATPP